MKSHLIVGIALALLVATGALAADTYTIDPAHSNVGFSVKHMMVSTVRGVFSDVKGTITADPADLAKSGVEVEIAAASISTSNTDRDNHLRSADFFDVGKYPTITFKSTRVERKGDAFLATGVLTMKGMSKEVALPFTVAGPVVDPWGNTRYGLEFDRVKLSRKDFGLLWNKAIETGGVVVGDEVTVDLAVELVKQKPPQAAK
ncbi:MAG TPA: YceI family protein [Thermoanaerobaculaceae bacterium]|nr:YceI family protein [Thermoanaerobaculaceae bacterium]HPS80012.1 YceI family protein [Thermoanaerobaculaceae bacterium]